MQSILRTSDWFWGIKKWSFCTEPVDHHGLSAGFATKGSVWPSPFFLGVPFCIFLYSASSLLVCCSKKFYPLVKRSSKGLQGTPEELTLIRIRSVPTPIHLVESIAYWPHLLTQLDLLRGRRPRSLSAATVIDVMDTPNDSVSSIQRQKVLERLFFYVRYRELRFHCQEGWDLVGCGLMPKSPKMDDNQDLKSSLTHTHTIVVYFLLRLGNKFFYWVQFLSFCSLTSNVDELEECRYCSYHAP